MYVSLLGGVCYLCTADREAWAPTTDRISFSALPSMGVRVSRNWKRSHAAEGGEEDEDSSSSGDEWGGSSDEGEKEDVETGKEEREFEEVTAAGGQGIGRVRVHKKVVHSYAELLQIRAKEKAAAEAAALAQKEIAVEAPQEGLKIEFVPVKRKKDKQGDASKVDLLSGASSSHSREQEVPKFGRDWKKEHFQGVDRLAERPEMHIDERYQRIIEGWARGERPVLPPLNAAVAEKASDSVFDLDDAEGEGEGEGEVSGAAASGLRPSGGGGGGDSVEPPSSRRSVLPKVQRRKSGAFYVPVQRPVDVEESRSKLPVVFEEQSIMEAITVREHVCPTPEHRLLCIFSSLLCFVLQENDVVIVCGETGSGKTTQVPQFLYEVWMFETRVS